MAELFAIGQALEREENMEEALLYYLQAAQQDYLPAIEALVDNNEDNNNTWLLHAAQLGSARSQFNLSLQTDSLEWLERSADQGFAPAQCNLGAYYEHGNPARALELYLLAANQGHEVAMCNAADLYYTQQNNLVMARFWYSKASSSSHNALAQQWTNGIDALLAMKCNTCQIELETLQRCSGCRLTRYCSQQCQQMDWPMHKSDCRRVNDVW